jgi:hypothetical protein
MQQKEKFVLTNGNCELFNKSEYLCDNNGKFIKRRNTVGDAAMKKRGESLFIEINSIQ